MSVFTKPRPIVITGGFGFIGSNLIAHLNRLCITPLIIERWQGMGEKWRNAVGLSFTVIKQDEIPWGAVVVHLGANVDTTEVMNDGLFVNNVNYTLQLQRETISRDGKFIYASSAATYGAEEQDFSERIAGLKPLNAYGFTKWHLDNSLKGQKAYGLRFFNVFGPREGYKGRMASVVHKALSKEAPLYRAKGYNEILPNVGLRTTTSSHWSLFKSHRKGIADGEQKRDFVAVSDVCNVIHWFIENTPEYGVYNVGSGEARSFNDLVKAVDSDLPIEYVDMPSDLRNQYQYFTQADLTKLRAAGYTAPFTSLEKGILKTRAYLAQ
jgi:ADP-L-glycero-D-manno-heptose 6-epimerase